MTTVINNPGESEGSGIIIGVIVALVLIALFFIFALPAIRNKEPETTNTLKIEVPTGSTQTTTY